MIASLRSLALAVPLTVFLAASASAWEIPLTVEDPGGKGGPRKVSGGVRALDVCPLLVGPTAQ